MLVKTSRPRLTVVYQRSRLFERLDTARQQHSATLVNGPPGAGKTTLVASYLKFRNLECLWYQMDSGDDDVATFFHYFSQVARKRMSANPSSLPDFEPGAASDLTRFSRSYFREFYAGLETPLVVVFDNYQELADASPLHDVAQAACEETPEDSHIIIVTREACPKPLARMRFNHALTIIGPDELILTLEETQGIAEARGVKLPSAAATQALQTRSAGWMMGLTLLLERVGRNNNVADLDSSPRNGQEEPIFEYFVGEVFRKLDIGCRDLLLQSALLPKMTINRITQLTGTPKAGTLLLELVRRNHFVTSHDGGEYAYQFHPLFREFLLNQGMLRYTEADLATHYCKAAEVLIADGDNEGAIELLGQSRNWPRMAEVILATAPALTAQGRLATLNAWMRKLPADLIEASPWLLYWHGSSKVFSDPADGQATLEQAYRRFLAIDDLLGMALSWSGLMDAIFSIHNDLGQMDHWVVEFNERLKDRLEELPADLRTRATLAFFTALSFRQPLHPDTSFWLGRVRKLLETETSEAERSRLRQHLVTYHLLRGEHAEAASVLSMFHYANDLCALERSSRTVVDYISEAMVAMHMGMGERCLHAVSEGLRAAEGTGNRLFDSALLQLGAVMSLNRGEHARADGFLAAFEHLAEGLASVDRGAYYAVAAWRKFHTGESTLALQLLAQAVAASEARGTPYYIAADNLGYGLLLHLCGKAKEASRHLELGRKVGAGIKNPLIEYVYQLFSAYVALDSGGGDKAHAHLANGMRIGRQHGYMHFFFFPPRVMARLCLAALEAGIEPEYVRALIERNEFSPDPAWRQTESWPWAIRIYTLGRFGVVKHGVALRFTGKAQKKPLELLKALIAFGGRDVPEAKLLDALWPEAEGDAAAQALATTLFRLRKLVGERVIRRQESRLTLDPTFCWVDCWAFERLSNEESGDAAMRAAKLRKLYQGPFLDGEEVPWARPMRDRLNAKLARVARTLTGMFLIATSSLVKSEDGHLSPWFVVEFFPY